MVPTVTPTRTDASEVSHLLARREDTVVLDVRSPGEFAAVHIDGSVNVPLDVIETHAGQVAGRLAGPVVVVCAQGVRSQRAASLLAAQGAVDLRILDGGIGAWESAGERVRRGRGRWAMDRQVRLVAGSLVLAGVLASTRAPAAKWLSAAIGSGLAYSAISNTCAMARVLGYLPYNRSGPAFDLDTAIAALDRQ